MDIPAEIAELFLHRDGSLPGVYFENLSEIDVKNIYGWLAAHSSRPNDKCFYWSISQQDNVPLNSVANPAALLFSGETESFCYQLRDLRLGDQVLNDLSIYVHPDMIELYWGGEADWNLERINAFISYLKETLTPELRKGFTVEDTLTEGIRSLFLKLLD
jgi:hypothetical protein